MSAAAPPPPPRTYSPRSTRDAPLRAWFESRGWTAAGFQREVWARYLRGESGLLVTPTGSGKTLAVFGGPLLEGLREVPPTPARRGAPRPGRLRVLWVTPLRALAVDTVQALQLPWTVAMRTGDASSRDKRLARQGQAEVVVITPESLALQLSHGDSEAVFAGLQAVVVDEWHELLGSKRGVLLQLDLAQLRQWRPALRIWGLSATLGNLEQARAVLLPHLPAAAIVGSVRPRPLSLHTLVPERLERFAWAGHLGLSQLPQVHARIAAAASTLLFTNTRAQAELWHRALAAVWMGEPESLALHHGSLAPELRLRAEQGLRDGSVRCVVATSSLDLGVDFPAVDQVIQLGSPKGMARLLQRAGRARHRPGQSGALLAVPTHALELLEYAAAREALAAGQIEARPPLTGCVDVLAQHLVSQALARGFTAAPMLAQVRSTHAFAALDPVQWQATLDFIVQGGRALAHYPEYCRVQREDGVYRVDDRRVALRHRLSIGTISSDGAVAVRFLKGGGLGSVEEAFISRLRPGEHFQFAGRTLELVRLHEMSAYVRLAKGGQGAVPRWQGGQMSLSNELGRQVQRLLAGQGAASPEMQAVAPLLQTQARLSQLPANDELLVEQHRTRDGSHLCLFAFAGRAVHEGLATLLAWRLAQLQPRTLGFAVNDYGLILSSAQPLQVDAGQWAQLLSVQRLRDDLLAGINLGELARRQFRQIARVAGLLPPSLPGRAVRSLRQLQVSSGLLYDVLRQHDPGHVLLQQADEEVLQQRLDINHLSALLAQVASQRLVLRAPPRLTPLAFPLWAESLRGQLSSEDWKTRVQRAAQQLEKRHA